MEFRRLLGWKPFAREPVMRPLPAAARLGKTVDRRGGWGLGAEYAAQSMSWPKSGGDGLAWPGRMSPIYVPIAPTAHCASTVRRVRRARADSKALISAAGDVNGDCE
jgi:hypothetical protein